MDDVFILFRIACLIGHIPTKGFKEGINKFYSELSFIVGRATVCLDVSFETLNKGGYLLKGFFHRKSPLSPLFLRGVKLALMPSRLPAGREGQRDTKSKD
jgi:hypothetical protein